LPFHPNALQSIYQEGENVSVAMYINPTHLHLLAARQSTIAPAPNCVGGGGIAGIVLGTFFGTLLLVYFYQTLTNPSSRGRHEDVIVERKVRNGRRRRGGSHSSRSRGSYLSEEPSVRRPSKVYSSRGS